jgi:hypothetical protein
MFLVVVVLGALVVRWMRCKLTRRSRSAGEYDSIQTEVLTLCRTPEGVRGVMKGRLKLSRTHF